MSSIKCLNSGNSTVKFSKYVVILIFFSESCRIDITCRIDNKTIMQQFQNTKTHRRKL